MRYFYFLVGFILENFGKTAVFPGGYGCTLVRRPLSSDSPQIGRNKDSFIYLEQVNNPGSGSTSWIIIVMLIFSLWIHA